MDLATEPADLPTSDEKLGIAGSGTIATGLAAIASTAVDVTLWARSIESAHRARKTIEKRCERLAEIGADAGRVQVVTHLAELAHSTFLVEAISEDYELKSALLTRLASYAISEPEMIVATTTSSLSVEKLAAETGHAERFLGFHVFNPVPRMELVEIVLPAAVEQRFRDRAFALAQALGKTPVEVPDTAGFVVNRLLFPYLFDAVELMCSSGLEPAAVDACMTLGAGLPMGPLRLLDFVGLDVAQAIGESLGLKIPEVIEKLISEGSLGIKSANGFYKYP